MQGTRAADVPNAYESHPQLKAGEYRRVQYSGEWVWEACTPNGLAGNLKRHDVAEHEDGTITVSPSILVEWPNRTEPESWHGYLERGVWRQV